MSLFAKEPFENRALEEPYKDTPLLLEKPRN